MSRAIAMQHDVDPKDFIWDQVRTKLEGIEVLHNEVLIASYVRPARSKSGIFIPDTTRAEDEWQGKVGLVLMVGPAAFFDDVNTRFHGVTVKPGDWVAYRAVDGWSLKLGGVGCKMVQDFHIKMKLIHPDVLW